MKENTNIEDLFRQKFENFQPQVDPSVWAGIQSGVATTTAVTTGMSAMLKIGLVSGGIIAASVATWYFGFYESNQNQSLPAQQNVTEVLPDEQSENEQPLIIVNDVNDPVIQENREKIEKELRNNHLDQSNTNTSGFNTTQNTNTINGSTETNTNIQTQPESQYTENNTVVEIEEIELKEKLVPTGRMEIDQQSNYVPAQVSFVSNARNQKEVKWYFGDGTETTGNETKHTYTQPGKYTVKMVVVGSDKINYEESQEIVVASKSSIDNVPNVITPNGDRINDVFSIKATNIETFMISIRDQRGNEIYSSQDVDFTWEGTDYDGNVVEKGMYTYQIIAEGTDGSVIKLPGLIYVE
ncbi:MAG: gliding motility-associated C-terminal domain-containing protein [Crocinitomicaceae bacterium]|nr:gliding motility-associated C-terminal domain-containing protein [Crocinitomicaceae bacterium]MBK8927852.1 gliding motility-associated C-terminal domain-containing protein [Crocinitomicaceae bacterium]